MRILKERSQVIENKTGFEFEIDYERAKLYVDEVIAEIKDRESRQHLIASI